MAHKPASKEKRERSQQRHQLSKPKDYTSHGITDNDIFMLPVSDLQIMLALTILALAVRLFRIYQPTSVVFDEVQYVFSPVIPDLNSS